MVIMERLMGDRRYKLVNNRFIVESRDGFVSEERVIDNAAEFGQILDKTFDIEMPIPVKELFAKFEA
jgi:arylamine N-acetyltransferase